MGYKMNLLEQPIDVEFEEVFENFFKELSKYRDQQREETTERGSIIDIKA